MSINDAKNIAEIIQSVGVGVGAFLGGLGALKVLQEWQERRRLRRLRRKWAKRFPNEALNQDFSLLSHSYSQDSENIIGRSSHVYICDDRTKKRHWVANDDTLSILGFNQDEVKGVAKKVLDAYGMGEQIDLASYGQEANPSKAN
jgi:hypothetical protein